MKFKMSTEVFHVEAGVVEMFKDLRDEGLWSFLRSRDYGDPDFGVLASLACLPPETKPKQRVQFSKRDNYLLMDVMLDFDEMVAADEKYKRDIVANAMMQQIAAALRRYPKLNFDVEAFSKDLRSWFEEHGWTSSPN